jgi:hypothetical protein
MEVYEMDQKMFCYQCEQTAGTFPIRGLFILSQ